MKTKGPSELKRSFEIVSKSWLSDAEDRIREKMKDGPVIL
jgi:hypothetical protein